VALLVEPGCTELDERIDDVLARTAYAPLELLVVHAGSPSPQTDARLVRAENDPRVRIVQVPESASRADSKNRAVQDARGEVVVLLDADLRFADSDWLTTMVSHALRRDIGFVGTTIVGASGAIVEAGIVLNGRPSTAPTAISHGDYFSMFALTREVSAIPSACMAFRRSVYLDAGGLQADRSFREAEVELCSRVRQAGRRTIVTPDAELARTAVAPGHENTNEAEAGGEDPFYNPNLSLDRLFQKASNPSRRAKPWAAVRKRLWTRQSQALRARLILGDLPKTANVLEVGASYSPIAPRADGWKTAIVDHASRSDLVAKYRDMPDVVDTDRIEDVDYIWSGGSIADAVPAELHGTFDALIASHVIEHVPDVVGFLRAMATLLREDGTVILAVPDKRFCFDYFRPLATTAHVLEAHESGRIRHTRRTAFEQWAYTVTNAGTGAWGQEPVSDVAFMLPFGTATELLASYDAQPDSAYVDMHAWQFTPSSFELILLELAALNRADWAIESITSATGCEFLVRLRRGGIEAARQMSAKELDDRRLELMKNVVREIGEQARLAADGSAQTPSTLTRNA